MEKKILVKAPEKKEDLIASFSFFHSLREIFPLCEINIIVDEENEKFFQFISNLKFSIYSLPKIQKNITGLHKYAVNLTDVFNIDIYFDLEGSKLSSLLGVYFRCEKRLGSIDGISDLLFHSKEKINDYRELLNEFLEENSLKEKIKGGNTIINKDALELPDYIFVFLDGLDCGDSQNFWTEVINSFENIHFIFYRDKDDLLLTDFVDGLNKKNSCKILLDEDFLKVEQFIINSKAILSNYSWPCYLASYMLVDSFLVNNNLVPTESETCFYAKPQSISIGNSCNESEANQFFESPKLFVDNLYLDLKL